MRFDDVDEIWSALEGGVGPAGAYVRSLDPASRHGLRRRLGSRWSPRRRPGLRFGARMLMVRGVSASEPNRAGVSLPPAP